MNLRLAAAAASPPEHRFAVFDGTTRTAPSLNGYIAIVDSTPLPVCHNRQIRSHKVFKELAKREKSSTGWFYEFKLHIVIDDSGNLLGWTLIAGNVDDRKPMKQMCEGMEGLFIGDKGYISSKLFKELYEHGLKLITKIKSNMKNVLMDLKEKFF
ncbi:hypothetical protein SCG7086_BJ_00130 [Chlamydiales bacterium SCGC AG-110-P3]|nr:hypothetical protein SCG7086_BJ_00130 [Chlamydiales bacterium SCGC AG-110-P3]